MNVLPNGSLKKASMPPHGVFAGSLVKNYTKIT
jgi:hypothetical protein